jgi:hypothetical protein
MWTDAHTTTALLEENSRENDLRQHQHWLASKHAAMLRPIPASNPPQRTVMKENQKAGTCCSHDEQQHMRRVVLRMPQQLLRTPHSPKPILPPSKCMQHSQQAASIPTTTTMQAGTHSMQTKEEPLKDHP